MADGYTIVDAEATDDDQSGAVIESVKAQHVSVKHFSLPLPPLLPTPHF